MVTGAQEESNKGVDHLIAKVLAEEENPKHDADGNETEDRHSPLDEFEEKPEALDVLRVVGDELAGENVGPKAIFSLAESHLEGHFLSGVTVLLEVVEGVLEDLGSSLNAVVEPRSAVLLFVNGNRRCLAANDICTLQQSDSELVWVIGQRGSA